MKLTNEQLLGGALVVGAGFVAYSAWRRKANRTIDCEQITNRLGGTFGEPCPTMNFVDVCSSSDYLAWRERLSIQAESVTRLRDTLVSFALLSSQLEQSFSAYLASAATTIAQTPPTWTTDGDISVITNLVRMGCDLMNTGNAALDQSGRSAAVVQESPQVQAFRKRTTYPWIPILAGVSLVAAAYYMGTR